MSNKQLDTSMAIDKDAEIKLCNQRITLVQKILEAVEQPKKTILLFSFNSSIQNMIGVLAQWLLGATIQIQDNLKYKIKEPFQVKIKKFQISSSINILITEYQQYRVLSFENKIQKMNQQSGYLAYHLLSIANNHYIDNVLIYGAITTEKIEQSKMQIRQFLGGKDSNEIQVGYIVCDVRKQQMNGPMLLEISTKEETNKLNYSLDQLFSQENLTNLNTICQKMSKPERSALLAPKLKQIRKYFTRGLISLLIPCTSLIQNTINSKEQRNSQAYNKTFYNYKEIIQNIGVERFNVYELDDDGHKNDETIAYKWFVLRCIQIQKKYKEKGKQQLNKIQLLKDFFKEVMEVLNKLPFEDVELNMGWLHAYAKMLLQQSQLIERLNSTITPQFNSIVHALAAIKDPEEAQGKVALSVLLSTELKKKMNSQYYQLYSQLIEQGFQKLDLKKVSDKVKVENALKKIKLDLPLVRIQSILYNADENQETIVKEIQSFFKLYFQTTEKKIFDQDFINFVFVKSADHLLNYGLVKLALELYKNRKIFSKIETCVKQIVILNRENTQQIEQTYSTLSDYYYNSGLLQQAFKFSQLAYEVSLSKKYFSRMIQMQNNLYNNKIPKQSMMLVNGIEDDSVKDQNYFTYQFTKQFQADLNQQEYKQEDLEVRTIIAASAIELNDSLGFSSGYFDE